MITPTEITAVSRRSFDDTVRAVERLTAERGFRVLHVHDIQATLKEKGFSLGPYKIIEICNAKYAHRVLTADRKIGMMLPCKITVYTDDRNAVIVSGMRPTVIGQMYAGVDLGTVPQEVENVIQSIVEQVEQ